MKALILAAVSLLAATAHAGLDITCTDIATNENVIIRAHELGNFGGLEEETLGIPDSLSVIRVNDNNKDDLSIFISSIQPSISQTVFSGFNALGGNSSRKVDVAIHMDNFCGIKMIGSTASVTVTDKEGKQSVTNLMSCAPTPRKPAL